jgi:hypothetical protein
MARDRINRGFKARFRSMSKTFTEAELTAAVNGTAQALTLGTLPIGAVVLGKAYKLNTQFTGGAASSVGMTIGDAGSATSIMTNADVFGGATGAFLNGTAGVKAGPAAAATPVLVTFTPDGAHTLLALTAGSVTVEVYYMVPDQAV